MVHVAGGRKSRVRRGIHEIFITSRARPCLSVVSLRTKEAVVLRGERRPEFFILFHVLLSIVKNIQRRRRRMRRERVNSVSTLHMRSSIRNLILQNKSVEYLSAGGKQQVSNMNSVSNMTAVGALTFPFELSAFGTTGRSSGSMLPRLSGQPSHSPRHQPKAASSWGCSGQQEDTKDRSTR